MRDMRAMESPFDLIRPTHFFVRSPHYRSTNETQPAKTRGGTDTSLSLALTVDTDRTQIPSCGFLKAARERVPPR